MTITPNIKYVEVCDNCGKELCCCCENCGDDPCCCDELEDQCDAEE